MKLTFLLPALLTAAAGLSAAPITIFNTGANGSGTDSNYVIAASNDSSVPANAAAMIVATPNSGWAAPFAGSKWINANGSGTADYCSSCYYAFTTTFSLTGLNPMSAVLTGQVTADNRVALYLNNTWVSSWIASYNQPTNFSVGSQYASAFQNGLNTLSFVVVNDGGPMGMNAAIKGTADASAVPEPGAFGLVAGAGFLLVTAGLYRRRGNRQSQNAQQI